QLKEKRGWDDNRFLREAAPFVKDDRIAVFDATTNDLLASISSLGQEGANAPEPNCTMLSELRGHMQVLIETQHDKWRYMFEKLDAEIAQVAEARAQLAPMLADVEALERADEALKAQAALKAGYAQWQQLAQSRSNVAKDCSALEAEVARLRESSARAESLAKDVADRRAELERAQGKLELRRTEWVRERESVESRLRTLRETYADLRDQRDVLLNAGEAGNCPTCTRPLGEHFRAVLEAVEKQLETVEADGSYFRTRRDQLEAMPADIEHLDELRKKLYADVTALERRLTEAQQDGRRLDTESRNLEAKRTRLAEVSAQLAALPSSYDAAEHARLDAERERLVESAKVANRLSLRIEREPVLLRDREAALRQREEIDARRRAAEQRRSSLSVPDGDYGELRRLYDGIVEARNEAAAKAAVAKGARDSANAAAERAAQDKAAFDARIEKVSALEDDRRLHDELHRAYSELRNELNFQLRPEISEIASELLKSITDARYTELELDDKYRIQVLEDGVPKPVISGGEEDVANLVLRLAISQMIADRAGQAFSLLILDEVFGSLDDVRRANVVTLLRGLEDRFDQVIVITHIEGVRDGLDRVIQVAVDEESGAARVTQVDTALAAIEAAEAAA
ncbi:MAG TPA: SbcC/MukB-like Walker B domain-containing protein, partial [Gemmatimonadaceae bacterium]|nr:SbcC/MukB-like Walker B domain-containing protein [Gemmatimonadaceae bacterium]